MGQLSEYDDLEQQIITGMGTQLSNEVDREVLWGMLIELGWTRVKLSRFVDNHHAIDITYWLEANIKNPFEREGADFIFENSHDALIFILRWKDGS
jgi:hypothetical protein